MTGLAKQLFLTLPHASSATRGAIVVAAEVQETMNRVEQDLFLRGQAMSRPDASSGFHAEDDLAGERLVRFVEGESQDVGRRVQIKKTPMHGANRCVIYQSDFDMSVVHALGE